MKDYIEISGKTVEEAIEKALTEFGIEKDKLDHIVVDEGSTGILGIFNTRPAIIKARKIMTTEDVACEFLSDIFDCMGMEVNIETSMDEEENSLNVDLSGDEMGVLIGKRGQTLDSLQYLTSLVVNKETEDYLRVKLDTENYRERRKETLENLAHNIAVKVKRTRRPIALEPMNPYERRIIHSALQNDKYVYTKSEGEEPYRHVVVYLKRDNRRDNRYDRSSSGRSGRSYYGDRQKYRG